MKRVFHSTDTVTVISPRSLEAMIDKELGDTNLNVTTAPDNLVTSDQEGTQTIIAEASTQPVEVPTVIESYRCRNCRVDLGVDSVTKMPLDVTKGKMGSRFSVFCKKCQQFITIIDPVVTSELKRFVEQQ